MAEPSCALWNVDHAVRIAATPSRIASTISVRSSTLCLRSSFDLAAFAVTPAVFSSSAMTASLSNGN